MKNLIKKLLREAISASEAHIDGNAIRTVIQGKRNLGFITLKVSQIPKSDFWKLIEDNERTIHL